MTRIYEIMRQRRIHIMMHRRRLERKVRIREEVLKEGLEVESFAMNVPELIDDGLSVRFGNFLLFLNFDQEVP